MKIEISDCPSTSDRAQVENGLSAHASQNGHPWNNRNLGVFYRNENGEIVAGLIGETFWECLSIKFVWVSESLRGHGIGKSLVEAAEIEGRKRECRISTLNTFSFQAPEFYKQLGYRECGRIDNFPNGCTRYYYLKDL